MKEVSLPAWGDEAASEIVGNVLMIGITVLLATALAFSLSSLTEGTDTVNTDVAVDAGSELRARHAGGESVPVEGSAFVVTVDDEDERHPLSAFPGDVSEDDPDRWELGEQVCVSCVAGGEVEALTFVAEDQVVLDWNRAHE